MPQSGVIRLDPKFSYRVIDDELVRIVDPERDKLRKRPGYAVQAHILSTGRDAGAVRVRIVERTTGVELVASMEDFDRYGYDFDYGYGLQRGLDLRHWQRHGAAPADTEADRQPVRTMPTQPSLFNA